MPFFKMGMMRTLIVTGDGGIPPSCARHAQNAVLRWKRQNVIPANNMCILALRVQPHAWPSAWVAAAGVLQMPCKDSPVAVLTCNMAEDSRAWTDIVQTARQRVAQSDGGPIVLVDGQTYPRWLPASEVLAGSTPVAIPDRLGWRRAGQLEPYGTKID